VICTLGQEWTDPAAADRRFVAMNCPPDHSEPVWDIVVESAANRLVRRDGFWIAHGAVVRALEREGKLTYEPVAELVSGSWDCEQTPNMTETAQFSG
jgi:hypothetical protein